MILETVKYFFRFIFIILVQLLVVNNIQLRTFINPYIYLIFILTLPVHWKPWLVVILSFLTGAVMDTFSSTPGLHIAATTFMGYLRGFYLRFAASKEDFEGRIKPVINKKGYVWFMFYAFIMVLAHHTVLFFLEIYGFGEFFRTVFRIICSTLATLLLILLGQLLFYNIASRR